MVPAKTAPARLLFKTTPVKETIRRSVFFFVVFRDFKAIVSLRHVVNNLFSIERYVVIFFHLLQVLDMESVWKFLQPSDLPHHWKASNG